MKRNLKALGLTMVAVFALSAVAASAAQAANHHLTVGTAPAIITAEDTVNTVFKITNGNRAVTCTTTLYEGTVSEATSTEVTVRPTYSGCTTAGGTIPVTVHVNHCAYILTGETDVNGDAKTHLECAKKPGTEEDTEITLTYSVLGSPCVVHVTPQTPGGGVHYTQSENETADKTKHKDVTVEVTVKNIKWHETGGGFCPATATGEDGTLEGTVTAKAYKHLTCSPLTGTGSETEQGLTTPGNYYNECEGVQQNLTLTTT